MCATPSVLIEGELIKNRNFTCYPGFGDKKNIYSDYKTFENLTDDGKTKVDEFRMKDVNNGHIHFHKAELGSKSIFSIGTFPSVEGEPIPPIIVELKLNKASRLQKDGKYYKILPIAINFTGITS